MLALTLLLLFIELSPLVFTPFFFVTDAPEKIS
jgi:hypothetical protein